MTKQKWQPVVAPIAEGSYSVKAATDYHKKYKEIQPTGVLLQPAGNDLELHYTGDDAGTSTEVFKLPRDPKFLRALARKLVETAKKLETPNDE